MTSLANHHSSEFVKLIYIGDSGTGKTGSLISLIQAGYKLRVLDLDNGLESLRHQIAHAGADPNLVDYETRRDIYKATAQGPVVRSPKAFVSSLELMTKWSDDSDPSEWGADTVFVIDSLSSLGRAAWEWARGMNPSAKDPRQWYFQAQQSIENVISMLTSEAFHANVIVISHVNYRKAQDGTVKGYANAIGSALGPTIPKYFNTLILAESVGSGKNVKRRIKTMPTGLIDLKNPTPWKFENELPLETGLATIFEGLKQTKEKENG